MVNAVDTVDDRSTATNPEALLELVLATREQRDEIRELFNTFFEGGTPVLCRITAEKLREWWKGIMTDSEVLLGAWPTPPGVHHVHDLYYTEAVSEIDSRISMVLGTLRAMEADLFTFERYMGMHDSALIVFDEVWNDLVSRTEKFCEGRVLA